MSAQFAGLAVALRGGAYKRAGIDVQVLPLAGAGETAEEEGAKASVSVYKQGSVTFIMHHLSL